MRPLLLLLLASCTTTEVGDTLLPDEFTLGHGRGEHIRYEGETETTYGAFTWHLPSIDDGLSRQERVDLRAESLRLDLAAEEEQEITIGDGATFKADARHATIFAGVIGLLIIFLLIKLRRSNGWH